MAHNINYNKLTKKHSMFSRKEIPWHGLGQVVEEALTSEEAIVAAGLNYDVAKVNVYADFRKLPLLSTVEQHQKKGELIPNLYATVRTDTREVLGTVGNRYEIVQNLNAFDFIDAIVGSKEAIFETAGALGNGERIFVTAKLPNNIRIKNTDDVIDNYILFTNSHDGSNPVIAGFTPIRVVCNNTLNMALNRLNNNIRLRHTKNVQEKIQIGLELMQLERRYSMEFEEVLNHLASVNITSDDLTTVTQKLLFNNEEIRAIEAEGLQTDKISAKKRNVFNDLEMYIDTGVGQELHRGTALWLYNGISSYYSNAKEYKSKEDRFTNILEGTSNKIVQNSFNLITQLF